MGLALDKDAAVSSNLEPEERRSGIQQDEIDGPARRAAHCDAQILRAFVAATERDAHIDVAAASKNPLSGGSEQDREPHTRLGFEHPPELVAVNIGHRVIVSARDPPSAGPLARILTWTTRPARADPRCARG